MPSYTTSVTKSANQLPRLKKRVLSSLQQKQHNFSFGQSGEQRAVDFLSAKNFQILDRNVRSGRGELDIVALDRSHDELVFVEVKSRGQEYSGSGSSAVNHRKLKALISVGSSYRKSLLQPTLRKLNFRFDIVCVLPDRLDHYENVTWGMVK